MAEGEGLDTQATSVLEFATGSNKGFEVIRTPRKTFSIRPVLPKDGYGAFFGVQVLRAVESRGGGAKEVLLECPAEAAFWSQTDGGFFDRKRVIPPDDARSVKGWDRSSLPHESDVFNLWLRVPNILLPIYHAPEGKADLRRDGHYSWIGLHFEFLSGSPVWSVGIAAGGDTENLFWFKRARWTDRLTLGAWMRTDHGADESSTPDGATLTISALARQAVPPSPLPFPAPRTTLVSAAEQLLGLDGRTRSASSDYEDPYSRLEVAWEWDAPPERGTLRPAFQRAFLRREGATHPVLRPGEAAGPAAINPALLPIWLVQRPRTASELRDETRYTARRWFVQPSTYWSRAELSPDVAKRPEGELQEEYRRILLECFAQTWKALTAVSERSTDFRSSALFALTLDSLGAATDENAPAGLLPFFDLAVDGLDGKTPYPPQTPVPPGGFAGAGIFRLEMRPPALSESSDAVGTIEWQFLRDHENRPLLSACRVQAVGMPKANADPSGEFELSSADDPRQHFTAWAINWKVTVERAKEKGRPIRAGAFDFVPATGAIRSGKEDPKSTSPCCFFFSHPGRFSEQWNFVSVPRLTFHAFGWKDEKSEPPAAPKDTLEIGNKTWVKAAGLRLALANVLPGETDHDPSDSESLVAPGGGVVSNDRPLLVVAAPCPSTNDKNTAPWALDLREISGQSFTRDFRATLFLFDEKAARESAARESAGRVNTLYLDRSPFFVCLVSTDVIVNIPHAQTDELAEFNTKGLERGWRLTGTRAGFTLELPPQGVGEAMEKGKRSDGYDDIEEHQTVDFRLTPTALVTVGSTDFASNFGAVPWSVRLNLNALKKSSQVGLPLLNATFEMLYGMRMRIARPEGGLRIGEIFARLGVPREPLAYDAVNREYGSRELKPVYDGLRSRWESLLDAINARPAIYEVFDATRADFTDKGDPAGLELEGDKKNPEVVATLRPQARTRPSIPAAFPSYADGLAGSFGWAFESKNLFESLWNNPLSNEQAHPVESVEATVARLYFSALGGWSSQRAAFAGGKIVIVVNVEMGRVSELRVEVIGRLSMFWNKAKLVTVFRRSVLPSDQFQDQQDHHEGRPLLRKVEEYIELLEKYRLADDHALMNLGGKVEITPEAGKLLPGCLKATSCEEKILVDARWGKDVYDSNNVAVGFKLPLRKPGAPTWIYGPANLLMHFYAQADKANEDVCGRIENLEDVYFWTDTRSTTTADTDTWPPVVGIDAAMPERDDPVNADDPSIWQNPARYSAWVAARSWGTPPVNPSGRSCTFRLVGLTRGASLNEHLLPGDPATRQERPLGSILRNVTLSRGRSTLPAPNQQTEKLAAIANDVADQTAAVWAHTEHVCGLVEQLGARGTQVAERVFGWEEQAVSFLFGQDAKPDGPKMPAAWPKLCDDLHSMMSAADEIGRAKETFRRQIDTQLSHFKSGIDFVGKLSEALTVTDEGKTMPPGIADLRTLISFQAAPDKAAYPKTDYNAAVKKYREETGSRVRSLWNSLHDEIKSAVGKIQALTEATEGLEKKLKREWAALKPNGSLGLARVVESLAQSPASADAIRTQLEDHLRGVIAGLFNTQLPGLADAYLATKIADRPKFVAQVGNRMAACLEGDLPKRAGQVVTLWAQEAETNPPSKEQIPILVDKLLLASMREIGGWFERGAAEVHIKPSLIAEKAAGLATAISARADAMAKLLDAAVLQHPDLVPRLRSAVPDWAYSNVPVDAIDPAPPVLELLIAHARACADKVLATLPAVEAAAGRYMSAYQQFASLQFSGLGVDKDTVLNVFRSAGGGQLAAWLEAATTSNTAAWDKFKGQLQSVLDPTRDLAGTLNKQGTAEEIKKVDDALKRAGSPLVNLQEALGDLRKRISGCADEIKNSLRTRLTLNVQQVTARAQRELDDVAAQFHNSLGTPSTDAQTLQQQLETFRAEWLNADAPKFQRAMQNVAGTIEHAQVTLKRAKGAVESVKKSLGDQGSLKCDSPDPSDPPLSAVRKFRGQVEKIVRQLEDAAQRVQLPWLRGLPQLLALNHILEPWRQFLDRWNEAELLAADAVVNCNKEIDQLRKDAVDLLTQVSSEIDAASSAVAALAKAVQFGGDARKNLATALAKITLKLQGATGDATARVEEVNNALIVAETALRADIAGYGARLASNLAEKVDAFLATNADDILKTALAPLGLHPADLTTPDAALQKLASHIPALDALERGLTDGQSAMNNLRARASQTLQSIHDLIDVALPVADIRHTVMETVRAFGQVPQVPSLNFTDIADLNRVVGDTTGAAKGYFENLNARISHVSYAFDSAQRAIEDRLRISPVKTLVDRLRTAGGDVVEEARMRAATVETSVRRIGKQLEADADRMLGIKQLAKKVNELGDNAREFEKQFKDKLNNYATSLQDLLPDFGGLKLDKLLAASGMSDDLIARFQQSLKTQHGFDPRSRSAFIESELHNFQLDDMLVVFSFGPVSLRLRNITMEADLRITASATDQSIQRESKGTLTADWEVIFSGSPIITYEQAALVNENGRTQFNLDPKKIKMPSILQAVSDAMGAFNGDDSDDDNEDSGSGLRAGVINNLPTDVTGFVKFNLDIASAGAPTSGIQNLRISLFFELGLHFPRFPSLHDANLRISAGAGLSDREAPFIFAIWILGGCGWFQLRFDYIVPFQDGSPQLEMKLDVGLGVSASLAFDCGFASGGVYVALAVEIQCYLGNGPDAGRTTFSMVLTMAGNLNILGIISVQLLIMLTIGYNSPGPMIGTGLIKVSIKICWCFTLKVERSFTKRFGGGGSGVTGRLSHPHWPALAQGHGVPAGRVAVRLPSRRIHRQAMRMIV